MINLEPIQVGGNLYKGPLDTVDGPQGIPASASPKPRDEQGSGPTGVRNYTATSAPAASGGVSWGKVTVVALILWAAFSWGNHG